MFSYSYYKSRQFPLHFFLMITILFMKFNYYEFNTSVNQGYSSYVYVQNQNSTKSLRFRNFEPRKTEIITIPGLGNSTSLTSRKPRGFQFHVDDKDVAIDMEFIVPFVRIPVERSMDMTMTMFRNVLNLNVQSLLTTGVVVAVGGLVAVFLKIFFSPFAVANSHWKTSRSELDDDFTYQYYNGNSTAHSESPVNHNFIGYLASKLQNRNFDISKCAQRSICEYVQKSNEEVRFGSASSMQKILDGLLSFQSVHNTIKGTAVQEAVQTGLQGIECSSIFGECQLSSPTLIVFKTLGKFMKYLYFT